MFKKYYTIKARKHKAKGFNFRFHFANKVMNYTAKFDNSCYHIKNEIDHTGKNKLCGYTLGLFPVIKKYDEKYSHVSFKAFGYCFITPTHWNSIRVGWQPGRSSDINLYAYSYNEGVRSINLINNVRLEQGFRIEIKQIQDTFGITIDEDFHSFKYEYPVIRWGYKLNPYFGGRSSAPWTMKIKLIKH